MARIRSVHPGFFTDERLVCVSMSARMLFIGLGVEADDKGTFEWKPLTLKMRIFPADNLDVSTLLAELEEVDAIVAYEIDGRKYGAIRNFRKFQKPKTPNDIHPMPDDFRNYVGLTEHVSEAFPQKVEKPPQMEDGGWNKVSEPDGSDADGVDPRDALWSDGVSILKSISGKTDGAARSIIGKWCRDAKDDCALVLSKIRKAQADRVGEPVSWITAAVKPPDKPPPQPPKPRNAGEAARLELQRRGEYPDATRSPTRYDIEGDGEPSAGGTGIARRIAVSAG